MKQLILSMIVLILAIVLMSWTNNKVESKSATVVTLLTPHHDSEHDEMLRSIAAGDAMKPEPSPRLPQRVSRSSPRPVVRPAKVVPKNKLQELALAAAQKYGIDASRMFSVIKCESGWNPRAFNATGCDGYGCGGLGQHHMLYWAGRAKAAGFPGAHWSEPKANLYATARLIAKGGWGHYAQCL